MWTLGAQQAAPATRPQGQPFEHALGAFTAHISAHGFAARPCTHSAPTCDLCTVMAQASLSGICVRAQEPTPASSALNTAGPAQQAQQAQQGRT